MAFSKAFAAARKAGKKEFTYNGKRYNTKLAKDTPKSAPIPTDNPVKAKSGASRSTAGKKQNTFDKMKAGMDKRPDRDKTEIRRPVKKPAAKKWSGPIANARKERKKSYIGK